MHSAYMGVSFLVMLSVLGCGSSDKSDNVGGVPRSTALKDVTQSDLMSLCKANESQLESLGSCVVVGLEQDTQTACEASMSSCEKDDSAKDSTDIDCEHASTDNLHDCTVTVGEFSDCLNELERFFTALTCKDAGKDLTPPSCFTKVQSQCASLFGD